MVIVIVIILVIVIVVIAFAFVIVIVSVFISSRIDIFASFFGARRVINSFLFCFTQI